MGGQLLRYELWHYDVVSQCITVDINSDSYHISGKTVPKEKKKNGEVLGVLNIM